MAIKLYGYQKRALNFLAQRGGVAGLFMEMGTGKTPVSLSYLMQRNVHRVVVVCPVSVAGVWAAEVKKVGGPWRVVNLTKLDSLQDKAKRMQAAGRLRLPLIVLINYESYWREPLRRWIVRFKPGAIVLDEAHRVKGRATKQSHFAHTFALNHKDGPAIPIRLALTGTPVMNGLEDLFSLYKFIDPTVFGTVWANFEATYIKKGGFFNHEIVGYQNEDHAQAKLDTTAFQISKSQALGLPPEVDVQVPVALTVKTRAMYDHIRKEAIAEIVGRDEHGHQKTGTAIAQIVLVALLRMQQLTGGFIGTTDHELLNVSDEKLKIAVDLTKDALDNGQQVVIFCRFRRDMRRLRANFEEASYIHGDVIAKDRDRMIADFQAGRTNVILVQVATGSLGIDLTAATVGIFYSTGFSLGEFLQCRSRLHRHGQKNKVTFYHLLATKTVDEKIFRALLAKTKLARAVTRLEYAMGLLAD